MAGASFPELQARFRTLWPNVTLRSIGDVERTVVVVHSISFDVPCVFGSFRTVNARNGREVAALA